MKKSEMTFTEHLVELAKRIRVIMIAIIASTLLVMIIPVNPSEALINPYSFKPAVALIIHELEKEFLPPGTELIAGSFGAPFMVYIYVSFMIGVLISSPVIAYEIYAFINPALYPHERKAILHFFIPFIILFCSGLIYSYKLLVPLTFKAMVKFFHFVGAKPYVTIDSFINITLGTFLITGLLFVTPLFFIYAVKFGIIGTDFVTKRRRYIYGAFIILACIFTPDPTPVSALLLFLPLFILSEASIFIAQRYERKKIAEEKSLSSDS